jgi:hypothetical protein
LSTYKYGTSKAVIRVNDKVPAWNNMHDAGILCRNWSYLQLGAHKVKSTMYVHNCSYGNGIFYKLEGPTCGWVAECDLQEAPTIHYPVGTKVERASAAYTFIYHCDTLDDLVKTVPVYMCAGPHIVTKVDWVNKNVVYCKVDGADRGWVLQSALKLVPKPTPKAIEIGDYVVRKYNSNSVALYKRYRSEAFGYWTLKFSDDMKEGLHKVIGIRYHSDMPGVPSHYHIEGPSTGYVSAVEVELAPDSLPPLPACLAGSEGPSEGPPKYCRDSYTDEYLLELGFKPGDTPGSLAKGPLLRGIRLGEGGPIKAGSVFWMVGEYVLPSNPDTKTKLNKLLDALQLV